MTRALAVTLLVAAAVAAAAADETALELSGGGVFLPGEVPYVGLRTNGLTEVELGVYRIPDPLTYFARAGGPTPPTKDLIRRFTYRVTREEGDVYSYDTVPLLEAGVPAGVYFVECAGGGKQATTLAVLSGLRLVAKRDASRMLVFATDAETGRPAAGLDVFLLPVKDPAALQPVARTAADGTASIPPPVDRDSHSLYVRRGADLVGVRTFYTRLDDGQPEPVPYLDIETDRPLYRPGHEVHFKVLARTREADGRYRLPVERAMTAVVLDAHRQRYHRAELTASDFGTAHGSFHLPRETTVGYHSIEVQWGKASRSAWFQVEEYRKPDFRVVVRSDPPECSPGDPLKLQISASYYFGEPVGGAQVEYELYWVEAPRIWWSAFEETRPDWQVGEKIGGGEGTLDAGGRFQRTVPAPGRARSGFLRIIAHVTDAANRRIAGAGTVGVVPGEGAFAIALDTEQEGPVGEPLVFLMKTSLEETPVSRPLKLRLTRRYWQRTEGSGSVERTEAVREDEVRTDAAGRAALRVLPQAEGWYCLDAAGADARGRRFEERHCLWVSRTRRLAAWPKPLALEPDRRTYSPGDRALVRLASPVEEATVLLTIEGPSLIEHRVISLTGGRATIPVDIDRTFSPNVHVLATLVSHGRFYQGQVPLLVPPKDRFLDLAVRTDRSAYEPGDTADLEIQVRDGDGRPAEAELSVKVVDEAIYALARDNVSRIQTVFYGSRYNSVFTFLSRWESNVAASQAADRPERGAPDLPDGRVRKHFLDTLFWQASARTGPDGLVRMRVPLADNLTTWRVLARGADRDTRVGQARGEFRARKPVMVRLGLPRFVGERDRGTVLATVHNGTGQPLDGRVRITAEGALLVEAPERPVRVDAGDAATLAWSYTARAPGTARFAVSVASANATDADAEEIEVPVHRHGLEVVETVSRGLEKERETARFPTAAAGAETTIELAPSLAGPALAGVEYLLQFPYGCVEQTMSSFLPAVLVARALRGFGRAADSLAPRLRDLPSITHEGLLRLYRFQHEDGGWGWWENDVTDPFMTAYVVYGLAQARRAGFEVDEKVLEKGTAAARALLAGTKDKPPPGIASRAYLIYALAEGDSPEPTATTDLFEHRADAGFTPVSRALLALTLARAGDRPRATTVLDELLAAAQHREGLAWWPAPPREARSWREDEFVATAMAVQAILAVSPDRPEATAALRWLMAHRLGPGRWRSTLDTAHVLYALAEHMRARREGTADVSFEVVAGGKVLLADRFRPEDLLSEPRRVSIPAGARLSPIEVRKRGKGTLYATLTRRSFTTGEPLAATAASSLSLERRYIRLRPERHPDGTVTYRREPLPPEAEVDRGALLLVVLAARLPAEAEYLMVEDHLPSGFEVVERPQGIEAGPPQEGETGFDHFEVRDDRAALFVASAKGGPQRWSYVLRAEAAGDYHAKPAEASLMYYPETRATSAEARFRVR